MTIPSRRRRRGTQDGPAPDGTTRGGPHQDGRYQGAPYQDGTARERDGAGASAPGQAVTGEESGPGRPERFYALTGGRGSGEAIDLVSLVQTVVAPGAGLQPETAAVLRLCRTSLSAAELSAYLRLPFSVVAALLAGLHAEGLVRILRPVRPSHDTADRSLLEAVMHGLQRL
ncbi:DUF742 domain-containing protein [Streptomyces sp. SPB074]|uniref:DUF742 domain-containing protein n=1 Tax=Streptomyces sp. (strain SPB074) TaxID=465543 RepID=UPI00017F1264|nr:DUF742 domain-containing protein [Streptomyces sp. SPB074]EDY44693.1 conserved hypothetical protein [Streptomyces sp. SPB074]